MNKSVLFSAVLISIAVISSPFIYRSVTLKNEQAKRERLESVEIDIQLSVSDQAAESFKSLRDTCPNSIDEMKGVSIKKLPSYSYRFETNGDCTFYDKYAK